MKTLLNKPRLATEISIFDSCGKRKKLEIKEKKEAHT